MIKFYDTNALLALQEDAFKHKFLCSSTTLKELENIKTSSRKSDDLKYRARKLSRLFDKYPDKYQIMITSDESKNADMQIIDCALQSTKAMETDVVFVSDDLCCKNLARMYGLNVESTTNDVKIYKGYKEFVGNAKEINDYMDNIDHLTWEVNQYLVVKDIDTGSDFEMRYDGKNFVPLKLPPSRYIKGKNALQRCALDILNNPKITAVAILGGYGSGKTFLSLQMGLYSIKEKGWQSKLLGVREVLGEGERIGYLPGDKEDKLGSFFLPLSQQLSGGEFELESLKQQGQIELNSPYFLKGTTYNNTVILVDEAEDLNEKQIKLIGTRVGENSRVIFSGDYKQSVIDASENNGLVKMCNEFRGDPKFGCIYLGEDVRSTTSKMFAELFGK